MQGLYKKSVPARHSAMRSEFDLRTLAGIDSVLVEIARRFDALQFGVPALIETNILATAEYPDAFPQLLFCAGTLRELNVPAADLLSDANIQPSCWCLSPAVCFHLYAQFQNQALPEAQVITARGKCFRNEAECSASRRLEFEMREIVLFGGEQWVLERRLEIEKLAEAALRSFDINGEWKPANDPFFLPRAKGKAMLQQIRGTKLEYVVDCGGEISVMSSNAHGTYFAERFELSLSSGEALHTACIAIGLDRAVLAAAKNKSY